LEKIADSSTQGLKSFLTQNKLHFDPVSDEEKKRLTPQLLCIVSPNSKDKIPSPLEVANTTYYKIPFQEAADLIATRQCFVKAGFAYVPMRRIVNIIAAKFRIALSKSLAQASRVFSTVVADFTPIAPLLNSMNSQYTGKEYNDNAQTMGGEYELTSQNIDEYSSSMPLCMRNLHNGLQDDHKLKHHGRLQYGLFLKGAGMTMEESLVFFQREFTKIMTSEKFQKEYTYNIRHMYGKEGKRTNYTPYSCSKIILGTPPNSGEHHGCPYRHFDDGHLASILGKMQIGNAAERNEIMSLKKKKHYNLACQKHFEFSHPNALGVKDLNLNGVGEHPNAWYAASVAYRVAKSGDGDKKIEDASPSKSSAMKIITPQK
jgi:DNA primase large subunit